MSVPEPGKIMTPWAASGLKNTIPQSANPVTGNAGYDQGFPAINMTAKEAGGIPPFGQDFNGIFFSITEILQYMQAGGLPTYSSSLSAAIGGYQLGAVLLKADGAGLWRNVVIGNTSNPDSGGSGWTSVCYGTYERGLNLSSTGASAIVSISAKMLSIDSISGADSIGVGPVNLSASVASSGAGGLDTGTVAANTWYSVWVISNGASLASLISLSATAPTMPSGYVYRRRVGWIRTDETANKYPLKFKQVGQRVKFSNLVRVAQGVAGNPNTPAWSSVSLVTCMPETSNVVSVTLASGGSGDGVSAVTAEPTSLGWTSNINPPPVVINGTTATTGGVSSLDLIVSDRTVYYASTANQAALLVNGYEDLL